MPNDIKAAISVVTILVAAAFAYYEWWSAREDLVWIVLGTGAFMVVSMWIFPEAGAKKDRK